MAKTKDKNKSNPNNSNQYVLDPRQKLCWDLYIDPKSETFGNAYRSAIIARYEEDTALQITTANWFLEKTRRLSLLGKAEKNLEKILDLETIDEEGTAKTDTLRIQADITKFVASTQGKNEGYSTKTEQDITSKGEQITGINYVKPEEGN